MVMGERSAVDDTEHPGTNRLDFLVGSEEKESFLRAFTMSYEKRAIRFGGCRMRIATLFLFFVVVVMPVLVDASVNLNLKSSVLSNILRPPGEEEDDDQQQQHPQQNRFNTPRRGNQKVRDDKNKEESNFLRLDLSGRAQCHLLGPVVLDAPTTTTRPMIRTTAGPFPALAVVVGADYDFSQRWYGATRLLASLGWHKQSTASSSITSSNMAVAVAMDTDDRTDADYDEQGNVYQSGTVTPASASAPSSDVMKKPFFLSRLVPAGWKVQTEHSLVDDREFSGQVALDWDNNGSQDKGGPCLLARIDTTGKTGVSVTVPLHQRLQVQWKVSNNDIMHSDELLTRRGGSSGSTTGGEEKEWWMPDIRVDALGLMESKNEAWFPSPLSPRGRVGLRLFASRRLNWNAMGFANDQTMESRTFLKLEVQAVSGSSSSSVRVEDATNYSLRGQSITTARFETELERPVSTARLFLLQEHALGCSAP